MLQIWPMFPNMLPQLICASYGGLLYMTFALDDSVVLAPETLSELYLDELRELAAAVGVDPEDDA